jgi:hypothetical protein
VRNRRVAPNHGMGPTRPRVPDSDMEGPGTEFGIAHGPRRPLARLTETLLAVILRSECWEDVIGWRDRRRRNRAATGNMTPTEPTD